MLKKLSLSAGLVLASAAYAVWQRQTPPAELTPVVPAQRLPVEKIAREPIAVASPPQSPLAPAPRVARVVEADTDHELAAVKKPSPDAAPIAAPPAPAQTQPASPPASDPQTDSVAAAPADIPAPVAVASLPAPRGSTGRYADGEFAGDPGDTVWGPVQVEVIIRGGAVADVQTLDYPNHRGRSVAINNWALPMLQREAIQAQNAQVDMVSQATATSDGYQRSLASALARAKK